MRGLDLELFPGQSLLIVGPSGCGKSSILRAVAGLWSLGSGTIVAPPVAQTFFLPQKPYMPLGTLRQQLLFPSAGGAGATAAAAASAGSKGGTGGAEAGGVPVPDQELERLLKLVRLPDLSERCVCARARA